VFLYEVSIIIIIIMSLGLSARWGQLFTGSDFSMPADLAQGGTGHVHCADTILLCHLPILCMDAPFELFGPFYQILDVLLVYNRPFCRCVRGLDDIPLKEGNCPPSSRNALPGNMNMAVLNFGN
jgi:hypothetical protein